MRLKPLLIVALLFGSIHAMSQDDSLKSMDIYGFVMTDAGYNANAIDPNWYDVIRTTKLPAYKNQYGPDGNTYFSVRQTRFGVKGYTHTPLGLLYTQFEWELFGTGVDAGQTTLRLRHAYGEIGKFGVGQYWSPFMDIDVFPNTVEYWGPPGMAFFRNIQIRYMPIKGATRLTIALERPGASADQGIYAEHIAIQNVKPHFDLPDLSAEYRYAGNFGYLELAGIVRKIGWKDLSGSPTVNLSGTATGWGLNFSTNINLGKTSVFRGQYLYGEGIENYMNDATIDVGVEGDSTNTAKPIKGKALPVQGIVAFLDNNWNSKLSTSIGYSSVNIDNTSGTAANAFKHGDYAIVNLLYTPVKNFMFGIELQYGKRTNFKDDFTSDITKVQLSFKYSFSHTLYKTENK